MILICFGIIRGGLDIPDGSGVGFPMGSQTGLGRLINYWHK